MIPLMPILAKVIPLAVDPGTLPAAWSPYLAGALIGVLSWLTFLISNQALGASGAYAHLAGFLKRKRTRRLPYYRKKPPQINWEVMLVIGVVAGSALAAATGGELTGRFLPPMWVEHFGGSIWPRLGTGFLGGAVMAFGARLAGGCTSGHGISGTLQLSVGSWLALCSFFIGGAVTAFLLYAT